MKVDIVLQSNTPDQILFFFSTTLWDPGPHCIFRLASCRFSLIFNILFLRSCTIVHPFLQCLVNWCPIWSYNLVILWLPIPIRRSATTFSAWTSPHAPRSSRASSSSSFTTSLFSPRSTWQAPLLTTRRSTRSDLCAPTSERWSPPTPPSVTRGWCTFAGGRRIQSLSGLLWQQNKVATFTFFLYLPHVRCPHLVSISVAKTKCSAWGVGSIS